MPILYNAPMRGISFALIGVFVLTVQDAVVKYLSSDFSIAQILFIRSIVMLFPLLIFVQLTKGVRSLASKRIGGHLLRIVLNLTAFLSFFYALSRMPLADVLALFLTSPIIMAMLSGPLLGERVAGRQGLVIAIAFLGVLLMVAPQGEQIDLIGVSAVVAGSVLYTLLMIQTRLLSSTESGEAMVIYTAIGITILTGISMPWLWVSPTQSEWAIFTILGMISACGHFCLTQAYVHAPVYIVGPFDYTALIWGILFGYLFWNEIPTIYMLSGAVLVVGAGLYIYDSERRKARVT